MAAVAAECDGLVEPQMAQMIAEGSVAWTGGGEARLSVESSASAAHPKAPTGTKDHSPGPRRRRGIGRLVGGREERSDVLGISPHKSSSPEGAKEASRSTDLSDPKVRRSN
jgi:hypothetical protein